ncbi:MULTISPECIES: glycosyltransferase family 4 protein [unclassified Exiguobacterium]|uniref:glycosyltransferase family 4 protein n=1 Tax=unclassified Exiguobacterium TaxID=2644629 RepID=UPI001BEBBD22|nr:MULTISPECIES: glycosyltransferase family 4 protein [unclassified Exiguobacterium]
MKIAFIVYNIYGVGGTVRTTVHSANMLSELGHEVEIYSVKRTSAVPTFPLLPSVKLIPLFDSRRGKVFHPKSNKIFKLFKRLLLKVPSILIDKSEDLYKQFNLFIDLKLYRALKKIDSDVVISTFPSINLLNIKYVPKKCFKIGQEHSQYDVYSDALQSKIKKEYSKLDILTCLSQEEADRYKEVVEKINVKIIPNAALVNEERSTLENPYIITAGRLTEDKAFDKLVKIFAEVHPEFPEWKLKIFGNGEERKKIITLINNLGMGSHIKLLPPTKELELEMTKASIFALTSKYESFGMVIVESMAAGLPCISYASKGPNLLIENGQNGFIIEQDQEEEYIEKLKKLMQSKDLRMQMVLNSQKTVSTYAYENIKHLWDELIESSFKD